MTEQPKNIIYVPGVCNIGPEEIRRRRNIGWKGLIVAILLLLLLILLKVNPFWRFFVFFPAALSATGFLQAYLKFCPGFAKAGVYNFGALGKAEKIADPALQKKDQKKGKQIMLYSALVGLVVAVVCVVI